MTEQNIEELKQKVLDYLGTVEMSKNRDIAKALEADKKLVDKAIGALGNEGKLEYLYLNGSFVKLAGK